jgi:hypothetical protein
VEAQRARLRSCVRKLAPNKNRSHLPHRTATRLANALTHKLACDRVEIAPQLPREKLQLSC